ncbi:hybrid sensor histidine kinase/response regulator [Desulfatitalea tepidiphila]|uniref:hybrid sensor histidine kinase/response regulator n=1 Tax=Desulfatitalea tepidiphila TaxID=1185843 RepID=UPI0006B52D76|nr:PAS domain S-box protein [Desulfatitalea tepidiphila]
MKSPWPLRRYLSLQFVLIAGLPLVMVALLVWLILTPKIRVHIGMQHQAIARAIAGQISAHLMGGQRQLTALADYLRIRGIATPANVITLLDAQCGEGELFETIYITSGQDETIRLVGLSRAGRSRRDDLMGLDLSGRDIVNSARTAGKAFWSETFLSTASSRQAVALAIPMTEHVIIGEITLGQIARFIGHIPAGAGLLTIVLDCKGRIVADSQNQMEGQQFDLTRLPPDLRHSAEAGGTDFSAATFELDGRKLLGTVVAIESLGWKVLVAQSSERAYAPLRAAIFLIGLVLVVALFLSFALAWARAGNLSQIFRRYTELSKSIAHGHYDLTWPPSKTLEFQNLVENLDYMARTISRRERQLVAAETHMRITLDSIGDAVIATDAEGLVTRMNPMAAKLTAWPVDEAVGQPLDRVFRIVNALTGETMANPVEKVLAKGEIIGLANDTVLIAKDGRRYQIADSGAPIRHSDGTIVGVVLVFRDVTESYDRERKIRQNEKLLKDLTANVPGVVYQFRSTRDHIYENVFVSVKATEIFGLDANPKTFHEHFHTRIPHEDKRRFLTSIEEAVDMVEPWHYEGRFIKPDGEEIWFSAHATPHEIGNEIVFYGVLMDITRRKQLEASQRIARFCFEKASIGIFLMGEQGQIRDVNEQACRSLGYTREELCHMTVFDIDPRIRPDQVEPLQAVGQLTFETLHRHKDGHVIPVQIESNVLVFEGQAFHMAFVQDISDRKRAESEAKRLEAALLQAQKMEAIGTLAGGIAHDFNNILAGVIGFAELSLWKIAPDSPVYQNLRKILAAGLRARDLVEQILTFSRQDERRLQPLQIAPLVKEALKLIRSSLPATIEISTQIAEDLSSTMADPTQIHRIIMNLCTNAAHAMEDKGGHLDVTLTQVKLSNRDVHLHPGLQPGDYVKLSVQDTGTGISSENIPKIYDPYFTTKPKGKGTGLGLSLVHGIVKGYGGAINVYSEPGVGTTFNIYLPAIEGHVDVPSQGQQTLPGGHEHILLVDDEPILVDVWRQILENLGYRVTTAASGPAALELFRDSSDTIDLVLTDMTMPKMTGDRLAIELLKIRPDLPIILCTGYSASISAERARQIGIKAFVQKPIVEADLANIIREVLAVSCPAT